MLPPMQQAEKATGEMVPPMEKKMGVEQMAKVKNQKLSAPEPETNPYLEKAKKAQMMQEAMDNPINPDEFKNT